MPGYLLYWRKVVQVFYFPGLSELCPKKASENQNIQLRSNKIEIEVKI